MLKDLIEDEESSGAIHDFTSEISIPSAMCNVINNLLFADYV